MTDRTWILTLALLAFVSTGASCSGGSDGASENSGGTGSGGDRAPEVSSVPGVDLTDLTSGERRIWVSLVNDLLSPCGEPVSVARCATSTDSGCRTCVPAARYVARLIGEGWERSEIEEAYESRYGRDTTVDIDIDGHPTRGAPMARVTIVEFSDFECPYCGRATPIVERLLEEYPGEVRLVFMNYPLPAHTHAMPAARAAAAAGLQGKFWEMHDLLFDHQTQLTDEDLDRYAESIGLDMERFHADLRSPEVQASVDADRDLGHELDVDGTPTIFVNGRRFREGPPSLPAYIREELEL